MARKTTKKRSTRRKTTKSIPKKAPTWDKIGNMIGSKIDKEATGIPKEMAWYANSCACKPIMPGKMWIWHHCHHKSRFFAAIIFAIIILYLLNINTAWFANVSTWVQILLVLAFGWMFRQV